MRTEGPAALERLLAEHDAAQGAERERLAAEVEAVAAQRYATVSRLFWHTDLERAIAAATASGRPILSLRLLGRLDEDFSCANSRFFRVALYANAEVSALLREQLVLHWSSERPAPRITIDFGDGKVLERTIAGNSAHYVLDPAGRPVDVIPGLYGPKAFVATLEPAAAMAREVAGLDGAEREARLAGYHREALKVAQARGASPGAGPGGQEPPQRPSIRAAEELAFGKRLIEMPLLTAGGIGPVPLPSSGGSRQPAFTFSGFTPPSPELVALASAPLDPQSRRLLATLGPTDWSAHPAALEGAALDQLVSAFERTLRDDTLRNALELRPRVHRWFLEAPAMVANLEQLNRRVYAELFLTPESDPWLGMSTPDAFIALPGDGIVLRRP